MSAGTMVVKHQGRRPSEAFEAAKLTRSIEAACLSVGLSEGSASDTARTTVASVQRWLLHKPEVTSDDIRRVAATALGKVSAEAGYLYQHHKTIL